MARSFLSLVQQACNEMNIDPPASVIGNASQQVAQLLALSNAEGEECSVVQTNQGAWPALRKIYTITLQNGQQAYNLPNDYSFMLGGTMWDGTQHWPVNGPVSPSGWNALTYATVTYAAPFYRFKVEAGQLWIFPTPTSTGDQIAFTYVSNAWCESSSGTPQSQWLADTDNYLLDERLFILGLKTRFKQAKGLAFDAEYALYMKRLEWYKGNAGVAKVITLGVPDTSFRLLSSLNIQDGNYGV